MKVEPTKIQGMFDYLYNPTHPLTKADGAFVFCRDDPLVAQRVSELFDQDLVDYVMFTGGIGKDSGYLTILNLPESKWQAGLLNMIHGIPQEDIYVEPKARHGGECCRFGMETIIGSGRPYNDLTIVIHPTQLRRQNAVLEIEAEKRGFEACYQRTGTNHQFDPRNPVDQKEAVEELLRLTDWPGQGLCATQSDLPRELVAYAREIQVDGDR